MSLKISIKMGRPPAYHGFISSASVLMGLEGNWHTEREQRGNQLNGYVSFRMMDRGWMAYFSSADMEVCSSQIMMRI